MESLLQQCSDCKLMIHPAYLQTIADRIVCDTCFQKGQRKEDLSDALTGGTCLTTTHETGWSILKDGSKNSSRKTSF